MSKILLVEDDSGVAGIVQLILQEAGHSVEVVHTGERAVYALAQQVFDLVILDYGLAGDISSRGVLEIIRQHFTALPVLMLSGRELEEIRRELRAIELEPDAYRQKPIGMKELHDVVFALLEKGANNKNSRP